MRMRSKYNSTEKKRDSLKNQALVQEDWQKESETAKEEKIFHDLKIILKKKDTKNFLNFMLIKNLTELEEFLNLKYNIEENAEFKYLWVFFKNFKLHYYKEYDENVKNKSLDKMKIDNDFDLINSDKSDGKNVDKLALTQRGRDGTFHFSSKILIEDDTFDKNNFELDLVKDVFKLNVMQSLPMNQSEISKLDQLCNTSVFNTQQHIINHQHNLQKDTANTLPNILDAGSFSSFAPKFDSSISALNQFDSLQFYKCKYIVKKRQKKDDEDDNEELHQHKHLKKDSLEYYMPYQLNLRKSSVSENNNFSASDVDVKKILEIAQRINEDAQDSESSENKVVSSENTEKYFKEKIGLDLETLSTLEDTDLKAMSREEHLNNFKNSLQSLSLEELLKKNSIILKNLLEEQKERIEKKNINKIKFATGTTAVDYHMPGEEELLLAEKSLSILSKLVELSVPSDLVTKSAIQNTMSNLIIYEDTYKGVLPPLYQSMQLQNQFPLQPSNLFSQPQGIIPFAKVSSPFPAQYQHHQLNTGQQTPIQQQQSRISRNSSSVTGISRTSSFSNGVGQIYAPAPVLLPHQQGRGIPIYHQTATSQNLGMTTPNSGYGNNGRLF
ncbi:hypothetical protein HK099_007067 [Clydaea vesicula]|uniref:Uncharacterized protein n=1 Tax=Clydaea vesicula TaxID=447962 RepID=A0AAD5XTY3_9FUNG|nr:hypothetical protein HK099_007067 [Clydaea vesicula]